MENNYLLGRVLGDDYVWKWRYWGIIDDGTGYCWTTRFSNSPYSPLIDCLVRVVLYITRGPAPIMSSYLSVATAVRTAVGMSRGHRVRLHVQLYTAMRYTIALYRYGVTNMTLLMCFMTYSGVSLLDDCYLSVLTR